MRKLLIACAVLFLSLSGVAQNNVGTPYSKYGYGLFPDNAGAYIGMGGVSAAMRDNRTINYLNPAAYTALDSFRFYFQVGYTGEYVDIASYNRHATYTVAQNAAVNMAFRLRKNLYMAFGFNEKTDIGYDLYNIKNTYGDLLMYYTEMIEGEGGLNEAYLGLGWKLGKLSLGVNASYIFGKIEERLTITPLNIGSVSFNYELKTRKQNHIRDVLFTMGAQYPFQFSPRTKLTLGGAFNFGTTLTGKQSFESYRTTMSSGLTEPMNSEIENTGKMFYPFRMVVGGALERGTQWLFAADYTYQRMSEFREFGTAMGDFYDYHKLAIGSSYQNNPHSRRWWERNWYTAGAYFTRSHLYLNEKYINTLGFTAGTNLSFRSTYQEFLLGISFDAGFRGTKTNALLLEQFYKVRLTFSFKELWFMKNKIH